MIVPPNRDALRAVVQGVGCGLPVRSVTNDELAERVDTSDAWIQRRTGIKERRVCGDDETTSSLCILAGREALSQAGVTPEEVDLIVCGTVTADVPSPSTASLVQQALDIPAAVAFDVGAACAGFVYSLSIAAAMLETGRSKTALVIGADTLTKKVDWSDRNTCVLFGDGAGAVVLRAEADAGRGIMASSLFGDGKGAPLIRVEPESQTQPGCITMAGAEVFRFAVEAMIKACNHVLEVSGLTAADIDLFIPHQANLRIIEAAAERLALPMEKVFLNVQRFGNTSGGSIPIALCEAVTEGKLTPGMRIMTVGFGAGLVWGANVIVW